MWHTSEVGEEPEGKASEGIGMSTGADNRAYLLIGVGRWGSNAPWLGIPVEWDEISGTRAIVEAGFHDFPVTPSQGSHFC